MPEVTVKWNEHTKKILDTISDEAMYMFARQILDRSFTLEPMDTGEMRRTTMAEGVKGSNGEYYVGAYTDYAQKVYNMPSSTHWSEPGTNNKWFERAVKKYGQTIMNSVIERTTK